MQSRRVLAAIGISLLLAGLGLGSTPVSGAGPGVGDGAQYDADGNLVRPANYRQWVNIGTGIGMAYGPLRDKPGASPSFTNVFVNPSSYRAFLESGAWPERTMFVLEVRRSVSVNNSSTGNNGRFQGEIVGVEAEVKDTKRFEKGWGFFGLGTKDAAGEQIPTSASCYSCHATNAAVENTFVQFYPVLRDVAKEHGTLKTVPESF
jgi:hypothetical protein